MYKLYQMEPLIRECFLDGKTFSFPINGSSMQPLLHTNDIVTIAKIDEVKKGDIILFKRNESQYVLHRVIKIKNKLSFVGDHQTKIETGIDSSQLVAKVVSYKKKGSNKSHNLNSLSYKIYKILVRFSLVRFIFSKLL